MLFERSGLASGNWLSGGDWSGIWMLRPSHAWIMLTGFMIQLALGVALWILPRNRRRAGLGKAILLSATAALNLGVVVVAAAPLVAGEPGADELLNGFRVAGMALQMAGIGVLVRAVWPRIQSADAIRSGLNRKGEA